MRHHHFSCGGDSRANAMVPALDKQAHDATVWGYYAYYVACPPLLRVENVWKPPSHECRAFNDAMAKVALDWGGENVVLAAMWSAYPIGRIQEAETNAGSIESSRLAFQAGFDRTLDRLGINGQQVWIVEQVPQAQHDVPKALAVSRRFGLEVHEIEPSVQHHLEQQAFVREVFDGAIARSNVHRIDPSRLLCDEVSCRVMAEGKSLYSDDDHLSEFGARWVSGIFGPMFRGR